MRYLITISLLFILSGCGVSSQHPLTTIDQNQTDIQIFGTWFSDEEDKSEYLHIGLNEDTGLMRVLMVIMHKSGESSVLEFAGHTSKVVEDHYLNLKLVQPEEERIDEYIFFRYLATSDKLSIGIMNSDMVIEAVKSGTLKGWVEKKGFFTNVYLRESGKKLRRYIAVHDEKLFPEIKTFRKIDVLKFK